MADRVPVERLRDIGRNEHGEDDERRCEEAARKEHPAVSAGQAVAASASGFHEAARVRWTHDPADDDAPPRATDGRRVARGLIGLRVLVGCAAVGLRIGRRRLSDLV